MKSTNRILELLRSDNDELFSLWTQAFDIDKRIKVYQAPIKCDCTNYVQRDGNSGSIKLLQSNLNEYDSLEEAIISIIGKTIQAYGDGLPPMEITFDVAKRTVSFWREHYFPTVSIFPNKQIDKLDFDMFMQVSLGSQKISSEIKLLQQCLPSCQIIILSGLDDLYFDCAFIAYNDEYLFCFNYVLIC